MATDYIVGIDLGEGGLDIDKRIEILEVRKGLDPDDRDLQVEVRRIEQELDRNLRGLNREINACGDVDKEHAADLWELYYAVKDPERRKTIESLLET
jgi:hypothetical protein